MNLYVRRRPSDSYVRASMLFGRGARSGGDLKRGICEIDKRSDHKGQGGKEEGDTGKCGRVLVGCNICIRPKTQVEIEDDHEVGC